MGEGLKLIFFMAYHHLNMWVIMGCKLNIIILGIMFNFIFYGKNGMCKVKMFCKIMSENSVEEIILEPYDKKYVAI